MSLGLARLLSRYRHLVGHAGGCNYIRCTAAV